MNIKEIIKEFDEEFIIIKRPPISICVGGFFMADCNGLHHKIREINPEFLRKFIKEALESCIPEEFDDKSIIKGNYKNGYVEGFNQVRQEIIENINKIIT